MKTWILILAQCMALSGVAQSTDVIFFTEDGEKFFLTVNGTAVNDDASFRTTAYGLSEGAVQVQVRFQNGTFPALEERMPLETDKIITVALKKNEEGNYEFRPVSAVDRPKDEVAYSVPVEKEAPPALDGEEERPLTASAEEELPLEDSAARDNASGVDALLAQEEVAPEMNAAEDEYAASENLAPESEVLTAQVAGEKIVLSDGRTLDWASTTTASAAGVEIEMNEPVGAQVIISCDGQLVKEVEVPFFYKEPDNKKSKEYFRLTVKESNGTSWDVKLRHSGNNRIFISNLTN